MENAPILISVYTRLEHLRRCIESLKNNNLAKDSVIYIVSDAAGKEEDIELVKQVREYISSISGFKEVVEIIRENNLGSAISIPNAINFVFEKHNRIIFLEDDNFLAPNFLDYVNKGLEFYKNNTKVFSINGYNYPINVKNPSSENIYFFKGYCAWGVGIWKDKWNALNLNPDYLEIESDVLLNSKDIKNALGIQVYINILNLCKKQLKHIDGLVCYHHYKHNMVSVFPEISKVRNYGHDGLGEHGGTTNKFINQEIDSTNKTFDFKEEIIIDNEINKKVINYFKISLKTKFLILLRKVYHKYLLKNDVLKALNR